MTSISLPTPESSCSATLASRLSALGWLASIGGLRALPGCAAIRRGAEGWEVAVTREFILPGEPAAVFADVAAEDVLPKVLMRYGAVPAVIGTADHTGPWTEPGSSRTVLLADGGSAHEQITHYQPGRYFAYRVSEFTNPIHFLARHARGEWVFTSVPEGTRIQWTYTFVARHRATALPLAAVTQMLWRGYMDVCVANFQRLLAD